MLTQSYKGSPGTISAVLHLFDDNAIARLSGPGTINALFYRTKTDQKVWTAEQKAMGNAVARLRKRPAGQQTREHTDALEAFLRSLTPVL